MNTTKCPSCGGENKNTNIRCEFCETELNHTEQNDNFFNIDLGSKKIKHIPNIILIVIIAPWFLIGLAFIGISAYSTISDNNKTKNYLETEGKLISYDNCEYDEDGDELCNAIYEYTINGITYKGSPNLLSNRSEFKQVATVKYNPDNPSEYVMNAGWNNLLIFGIIMIIVVLIIFISVKNSLKKLSNQVTNTIEKDSQDFL